MKLLILYTKDRQEVFNEKSALGSYINYLGQLLSQSNFEVYLNGELINTKTFQNSTQTNTKSKLSLIKKFVPSFIKRFIKERAHLNQLELFKNELMNSDQKYDLILEYYNMGSDVGMALAKHQNIPYYIFYDGPILDEYKIFNRSNPFFLSKIIQRQKDSFLYAKKIVAQSNPMKDYIVKNIAQVGDKIFIHQNVDYRKLTFLDEDKVFNTKPINIGFIGSFLKWHDVELLLYAFKFIIDKGIDAKLYLLGDGMEKSKMEKIVSSFSESLQSKITFTGFVSNQELYDYKKKIDIGVMSGSNWYGAPLKIFEYGAMKMACIAPDTPTIKDLFPNDEVKFFEWKNQESLNDTLFELTKNSKELLKLSQVLNQKIKTKYSAENTSKFYTDFLRLN